MNFSSGILFCHPSIFRFDMIHIKQTICWQIEIAQFKKEKKWFDIVWNSSKLTSFIANNQKWEWYAPFINWNVIWEKFHEIIKQSHRIQNRKKNRLVLLSLDWLFLWPVIKKNWTKLFRFFLVQLSDIRYFDQKRVNYSMK